MTTLAEFLLARIAEDDHAASEMRGAPLPGELRPAAVRLIDALGRKLADECGSKRAILQRCLDVIASFGDWDAVAATAAGGRRLWTDVNRRERAHAWDTLRLLAQPYAAHPDCKPEWCDTPE